MYDILSVISLGGMKLASKYGIRGIIYFEDYSLYSKCKLLAVEKKVKVTDIIAQSCENYLNKYNGTTAIYRTAEMLYIDCKKVADRENVSIASVIEKACAEECGIQSVVKNQPQIVEEKKRGSIFDLNRDAKR
ncbi:MAG: hypothetical protein WC516_09860 [Patescibacteria group bacterium]|jgi:hypothetical protein